MLSVSMENPLVWSLQKLADGASAIKKDTDGLYKFLQTSYFAVQALDIKSTSLMTHLGGGISVIELTDLAACTHYFLNGDASQDAKDGHVCSVLGMFAITVGVAGGVTMWLLELGFGELSSIAASMASIPIFGAAAQAIASVGLGPVVCTFVGIGYFCLAGDALQTLAHSQIKEEKIKAGIDLISRVAHVGLYALIVIPGIGMPAIIALGLFAKGTGLVSFLYNHFNKPEIDKQKQPKVSQIVENVLQVNTYSSYTIRFEPDDSMKNAYKLIPEKEKAYVLKHSPNYTVINHEMGR